MVYRLGDHCGQYLSRLAHSDERIWVLDGDLADSDGAAHFAEQHPERFIMAGIAEQSMISVAAGLASCQLRPFVFSFAAFICYRAYDQIRVCLSQSNQPVTLIGSHSGGAAGRNGKTHAALNDIALLASLPNFHIWAPADNRDVEFAIDAALVAKGPTYIRLPRQSIDEALPQESYFYRWLSPPQDYVIISTGYASQLAVEARKSLLRSGISLGHLHTLQVSPLPAAAIAEAAGTARCIFVVEDHYTFGGLASLIQHSYPKAGIRSLGWPTNWSGKSGSEAEIMAQYNMSAERIASGIKLFLEKMDG
jgi:transketolase